MKYFLCFLCLAALFSFERYEEKRLKPGKLLVSWKENLAGDFSFKNDWSYPVGVYRNGSGQLGCDGFCPPETDRMKDDNGRIFTDSLKAFYKLVDTTHLFHSIKSTAWAYEWDGTDFISVKRLTNDSVLCYTHNTISTHSSLNLILVKDTLTPTIILNSISAKGGTRIYNCLGGKMTIDRGEWNKGIMKADFDLSFEHKENPKQAMYWKGKIYAKME